MAGGVRKYLIVFMLVFASSASCFECAPLPNSRQTMDIKYERGVLFRASRGAGKPSYLMGTIHLPDPEIVALPAPVKEALGTSDNFLMEVMLDAAGLLAITSRMFRVDGTTLMGDVGEGLFEAAAEKLSRHGIPAEFANTMNVWAAFMTLSLPPSQLGIPLDLVLLQHAQSAGLSTSGLETMDEQLGIFESIPKARQIEMLTEIVCHYETVQRMMFDMKGLYLSRDLKRLAELSLRTVSAADAEFMESLIFKRNKKMLERMQPKLEQGGTFVAVGALHLLGPSGILQSLEAQGYQIDQVY
ncbi:MAG: TraB/GumN family protein [Pseudomonadota bacterium]